MTTMYRVYEAEDNKLLFIAELKMVTKILKLHRFAELRIERECEALGAICELHDSRNRTELGAKFIIQRSESL